MNSTSIPRPEYPRPDFVRDSFQNLNGPWEFAFDDSGTGLGEGWYGPEPLPRTIMVPYVYQSPLSGIGEKEFHSVVWYKKRFTFRREPEKSRTLLHFGAVDYEAKVWVNGQYLGEHTGGSTPFTFDVTQVLTEGENIIAVRVQDDCFDLELPRGKQYWKSTSEGIFYTPSTGIWQTVWLEQVSENRLEKLWLTPDVDKKTISMELELAGAGEKQVRVRLSLRGRTLVEDTMCIRNNRAGRLFWLDQAVTMDWNHQETMVWTPEDPVLFDLSLEVLSDGQTTDAVRSYCALRKVSVENGQFMLNNRPYYQKLLLDQGYWPDSLLTAPADEAFVRDIESVKRMGFNGVRKHQKVEDPRFLYHADRMGLLVWGECPSAYVYSRKYARRMATEWCGGNGAKDAVTLELAGDTAVNTIFLYRSYEAANTPAKLRIRFSDGSVLKDVAFSGDSAEPAVIHFDNVTTSSVTIEVQDMGSARSFGLADVQIYRLES